MKMVFVQSHSQSFAIELFFSLLKAEEHEVFLVFDPNLFESTEIQNALLARLFDIKKQLIAKIVDINPALVAFSVFTYNFQWALTMARLIKNRIDVPIIFGGVHPTLVPEVVIQKDCVDMICVGEGEHSFLELIRNFDNEKRYSIPGMWFKIDGKIIKNGVGPLANLDTLPFPDKEPFYECEPVFRKSYLLVSGRGCPYQCAFCETTALKEISSAREPHKFIRKRSVSNVIDELRQAKEKFKLNSVIFFDDVFPSNIKWLEEFAGRYKNEIAIPFSCTIQPNHGKRKTIALLKQAGCIKIGMGIQSASEITRIKVLKRLGSNKQIKEAAKACRDYNIAFDIDHIFNIPGEGEDEQVEALQLYNEIRPHTINTFWLTYFPKTEITEYAKSMGLLTNEMIERIGEGMESTSLAVGIGGKYSFKSKLTFDNFNFWMTILPLMPPKFMNMIIKKKRYRFPSHVPLSLVHLFKFFARVKTGRSIDTLFIIRLLITRMASNTKIKIFGYR